MSSVHPLRVSSKDWTCDSFTAVRKYLGPTGGSCQVFGVEKLETIKRITRDKMGNAHHGTLWLEIGPVNGEFTIVGSDMTEVESQSHEGFFLKILFEGRVAYFKAWLHTSYATGHLSLLQDGSPHFCEPSVHFIVAPKRTD